MEISLKNLGTANKNKVVLTTERRSLAIWFSYETAVGFEYTDDNNTSLKKAVKNTYSNTTGKLLNEIEPNKKNRIPEKQFKQELERVLKEFS